MKLTVEKTELATALAIAMRATTSRNTMPILANVLLEAHDDTITLTATDLDSAVTVTAPAHITENGAVAIPAALLNDLVSKLNDAPVLLELKDGKVKVRSGKSDYSLLAMPAEDYPVVPRVESGQEFSMSHSAFKNALSGVTFCASKEETRSILMGVLFALRDDEIAFVATDTHRLSKHTHRFEDYPGCKFKSTIIPTRPLAMVIASVGDSATETLNIRMGDSQVQFESDSVVFVTRVLDGIFPHYQKVIPESFSGAATINRAALLSAMRRVSIVARQDYEKAVFTFTAERLEINAQSSDAGTAREEVACECDQDIGIVLNARYLIEFLSNLNGETVTIQFNGDLNPVKITGDNADWLGIQMPMQV